MDKGPETEPARRSTNITGAVPAGITKKVASLVERRVKSAFSADGKKRIHLRGVRFIPSTRVDLGDGAFQLLANVVIEVAGPSGALGRPESVDSVVTVQGEKTKGQVLRTIKIPVLEWMRTEPVSLMPPPAAAQTLDRGRL